MPCPNGVDIPRNLHEYNYGVMYGDVGFPRFRYNNMMAEASRAVECIAIIMAVYLTTSLSTSAFMNWYNKRSAIKER